jgi:uncharacterized protein GlcG (DUF336 family)
VTLRQAVACIERGIAEARARGFAVAVAVVDEAGHLVACHRMDGALWITPAIARAKAAAAAAFRTSTRDMEQRFAGGPRALFATNVAQMSGYELNFGQGAVPVQDAGRVLGAVGVSGAVPADNDHAIAEAAAAAHAGDAPGPARAP